MIKINLSTAKKQVDLSDLGGFDLSKLNFKALIVVLFALYIPDFIILPAWQTEIDTLNSNIQTEENNLKKLKGQLSQVAVYEKQISDLKLQEVALSRKLTAAKQAIQIKKNPSALLLYVARNTPPELWINELDISNDRMRIVGEALDYNSIGVFVNSLRSSVFIREANISNTTSKIRESDRKRVESFAVEFLISRFDP